MHLSFTLILKYSIFHPTQISFCSLSNFHLSHGTIFSFKIKDSKYIFPPGYLQTDPDSDRERLALLAAALRRSQSTGDLEDHDPDDPEPGDDHGGLTLDLGHTSTEHEVVSRCVDVVS